MRLLESPPHPNPLPASGEREHTEFAALVSLNLNLRYCAAVRELP